MSTRPTCSAKVTIEIFRFNELAGFQYPRLICLVLSFRSSEATGGAATHGGVAQSRNAKEEGDAAQVFMSSILVLHEQTESNLFVVMLNVDHSFSQMFPLGNRQEEERRRREEEMLRKREMEEQMRRQREENYRMGNFMDVS